MPQRYRFLRCMSAIDNATTSGIAPPAATDQMELRRIVVFLLA